MADQLTDAHVLVIVTNYGIEQDELVVPVERLREQGASVTVAASEKGDIQTLVGDKDPGRTINADAAIADVSATDYDLLVVPGGTINADNLRMQGEAVALVSSFAEAGKPIAAICHGPWALIEADLVRGKKLTSYPSLQTDVRNAGGDWADEEVRVCTEQGFTSITSRNPDDLDAFVGAITDTLTSVRA